ncbi:uncharacterized protein N7496_008998 [Penicillium cataractarum]|uniref:Uncharacterized protein n=1 Tax=Penicillium cataractarum TaxID=2100454 RepID=A0A9W9S441_9EURO|nr:uncharacterized protein N7496_008998 [Penicillium cataractarum]KAJ5369238.1 hypothetical protein N7496_008998 [Penicillium cataractarum]
MLGTHYFFSIKKGRLALIDALLKEKLDLESGLPNGTSFNIDGSAHLALHTAAHYEHPDICQFLLDRGALVDEYDRYGKTALHYAVLCRTLETIDVLLDWGATIDTPDKLGQTALHGAARMTSRGSGIKLLLRRGANINATDMKFRTPLHLAGIEGKDDILKLLLDHGADPEARDDEGLGLCMVRSWSLGRGPRTGPHGLAVSNSGVETAP